MPETVTEYKGFRVGDVVTFKSWDGILSSGELHESVADMVMFEDGTFEIRRECQHLSGTVATIKAFEAGVGDGAQWAVLQWSPPSPSAKPRIIYTVHNVSVYALRLAVGEDFGGPDLKGWERFVLGGDNK